MSGRAVLVAPARIERWVANFVARHGETALSATDGALTGLAADGSTFGAHPPFSRSYDGPPDLDSFVGSCEACGS